MIKVFLNLINYDDKKSKFSSWVFTITKNHMIDKWRNNNLSMNCNYSIEISNDNHYISNLSENINLFTTTNTADIDFENSNSMTYISDQLSPEDYTLLNMKYILGYNYDEIGCEFNVTSSTISNRVNYIKTKLKKNNSEIIY
jgi:RNA polymerase sigma factor (sigma-70 family)